MESTFSKLGGSLVVPNVQELAKEKSTTVPKRYVRFEENDSILSNVSSSSSEVPVIDMLKLDGDSLEEFGKLHDACRQWGFFQLINHGVGSQVVENMKLEIQEFFHMPIEEKKKFNQEDGDVEGYGQAFVVSEDQKLDWADMFYIITSLTYLRKNHLIPKLPHKFRDAIEAYSEDLKTLAMKILRLMARVLKMKEEDMNILFEEGMQSMRMNYYPPCPQPDLVTGLCPHSDAVGLAILIQVNKIEGLHVKKDGVWIPVVPLPDAFVVNIGDILEIVTNGAYRSTEHRTVVNKEQERLSVVTFLSPKMEGYLGPAPRLVTAETPAKFKRIGVSDYFKGLFARELVGKSYLDSMRT
ncbi:LOW QUALITY PROTEIN: oxoglutarate-dependent flavonoid 7-O-demethylase 1-like [Henckelia pumila]|uniref:LOW QUALITY PROTEIN: oxoglutarate-dependent flavonoid 7-O-demethylase 1-like n=1 Tax=Henckelia pumila TaxID=405737 RepID=UPI003C6E5B17